MVSWLRHRYGGPTWRRIHSTKSYQPSPPGRTITARPMEQHPRGTFTHNPSSWLHLPDNSPTSGDISPDGTQIVLLSLHKVHYWIVSHGDNVLDTLQHHPIASLPTRPVGATEGICWDTNGRNYYEVAERSSSSSPASVHIYNRV